MKRIMTYISIACMVLALCFGIIGWNTHNFHMLGFTLFFLLVNNICYALRMIQKRIIFLLFQATVFTFLLGRPIFGSFRGTAWYTAASQAEENLRFALLSLILALVGLQLGAILASKLHTFLQDKKAQKPIKITPENTIEKKENWRRNLSVVALLMFYATLPFLFGQEIEKLLFMRGRDYIDYFSQFQSKLPTYVYTIASFTRFSLCLFLATFPMRRRAIVPLTMFVLSAVPALIIGERNPIVLHILFAFVYFCIREMLENKGKWIGKVEKILIVITAPLASVLLGMHAYFRAGSSLGEKNPLILLENFFADQGVSFDILTIAYGHRRNLPQRENIHYTFGAIIDYFQYGRIGQWLLGTTPMPDGNNIIRATEGNSLSHHLAYITLKENYLAGRGYGSSYILEAWLDYGYLGVFIVNIALGMLLVYAIYWLQTNNLIRTILFVSLLTIFLIPRSETSSWIVFLFTVQFWVSIGACYLGTWICTKSKVLQEILTKLHLYPKEA